MKKRILYLITAAVISSLAFVACIGEEEKEIWNAEGAPEIQLTVSATAFFGIKIELAGKGEMKINWGDDTPFEKDTIISTGLFYSHKYKSSDTYTISIVGDISYLNCSNCKVSILDVSQHPALKIVNCSGNKLTSIDVSKQTELQSLDCGGNRLTNLDIYNNSKIVHLFCGGNLLTNLYLNKLPHLLRLDCNGNNLTNIDVSHNIKLSKLDCRGNHLHSLDVSNNDYLVELDCSWNGNDTDNLFSGLDVSNNKKLKILRCCSNGFSADALNALFVSLHEFAVLGDYTVDITGNPGCNVCNKQIAENKGWIVNY